MVRKLMAVAALGLALLWSAAPAAAQATRINFTGTGQIAGLIDLGSMSFPDGQVHIRGLVQSAVYNLGPLGNALAIIEINANFSPPDMTGHAWGTFVLFAADGSVSEGTWTGKRERVAPDHWISEFNEVGRCTEGPSAGAEFRAVEWVHTNTLIPGFWFSEVEGYFLLPGQN